MVEKYMNFDDNKTLAQNIEDNCPELSLFDSYEPSINNFLDLTKTYHEYKHFSSVIKDKYIFLSKYFSTYNENIKKHFTQNVNISFDKNYKKLTISFDLIHFTYENGKMLFDIFFKPQTLEELKDFDEKYLKFREDIYKFNDNEFFDKIFKDFELLNKTISKLKIISSEYNLNAKFIKNKQKLKLSQFSKIFNLAHFNNEEEFIKKQISDANFKGTNDNQLKFNFVTYRFELNNILFSTHTLKVNKENGKFKFNLNGQDTDSFINLLNNSFFIEDQFISNKSDFKKFNILLSTKGRISYQELIENFKLKIQQQNIVDF